MRISPRQYAIAWYELLHAAPDADWSTVSQQFLQSLYRKGNIGVLPDILRALDQYEHEQRGVTPVTVKVAHQLDDAFIADCVAKALPGVPTDVTTAIDSTVLGGMQIETSNTRWNMSLRGKLDELKSSLKNT